MGDEHPSRVLIVDDDAGLRTLLRMTLESADLEVDEAPDARVAEDRIAVQPPDVVVLDIRMPGLDGLSFCRGLKRSDETRTSLPESASPSSREDRAGSERRLPAGSASAIGSSSFSPGARSACGASPGSSARRPSGATWPTARTSSASPPVLASGIRQSTCS